MKATFASCGALAAVLGFAPQAIASSITFENQIISGGTGHGAVATILVLQQDSSTTESGGVTWDGSADSLSGDAKAQSRTYSVADLAALAIQITGADTEFGLVFDINDTDTSFELQSLTVNFLSSTGAALGSVPAASLGGVPITLDEGSQGVGNSGFLFRVSLTPTERTAFFGTSTNRLAISLATVGNVDNGPDSIYLVDLEGRDPGEPTTQGLIPAPEPGSFVLLGSGLLAVAGYYRSRRRGQGLKQDKA